MSLLLWLPRLFYVCTSLIDPLSPSYFKGCSRRCLFTCFMISRSITTYTFGGLVLGVRHPNLATQPTRGTTIPSILPSIVLDKFNSPRAFNSTSKNAKARTGYRHEVIAVLDVLPFLRINDQNASTVPEPLSDAALLLANAIDALVIRDNDSQRKYTEKLNLISLKGLNLMLLSQTKHSTWR